MIRGALSKAAWVGRTASMVFGLVLALVVGLADAALGANGQAWVLGRINQATSTTQLNGNVAGGPGLLVTNSNKAAGSRALHLNVAQGRVPMAVNSSTRVLNLNADKLDGKDATQLGINGYEIVQDQSVNNSESPKRATARCPAGKVVIGSGGEIFGGKVGGAEPNRETSVALDDVYPFASSVSGESGTAVAAYELEPSDDTWWVYAYAICATGTLP